MSSHELIYFDGAGRAEIVRICLFLAKKDGWKDTRFQFKEWPTIKPTTPLGSVPILKIDGVDHIQSVALARYAGKLAGLYPEDPLEGLICDEMMDCFNEIMAKAPRSKDPEEFKKLREDFQATTLTKYGKFFEEAIQRNGGSGFTKSFTIADIGMQRLVASLESGNFDHLDPQFYNQFPGIMATKKMVEENEKVKSYYDSKK